MVYLDTSSIDESGSLCYGSCRRRKVEFEASRPPEGYLSKGERRAAQHLSGWWRIPLSPLFQNSSECDQQLKVKVRWSSSCQPRCPCEP